jgi:sigma-B regulation protein RsbU (phosphoserine phosphatase)
MPDLSALIWIVDDSPTQGALTERALGGPHRYMHFHDGSSVVEAATTTRLLPDLIILDWVMPGLSGDEVCRFLRRDPRTHDIPLVMLTASRTETADIVHAFESGANDYVAKPFVVEELQARISTLVRAARTKRAADREVARVTAINQLSRALLAADGNVTRILDHLSQTLVNTFADGCVIDVVSSTTAERVARHRVEGGTELLLGMIERQPTASFTDRDQALAQLPASYAPYVGAFDLRELRAMQIPMRGLAEGHVTLTRDLPEPFDANDVAAMETCLDLTGLAIEAALRAEAERIAARFQEEMIGIVSHDLRTPLGAMSMGVDLLRSETPETGKQGDVLRRINRSLRRMMSIVDQLLDVTRARIGQGIQLALGPTHLNAVVASVIDELRLAHPKTSFEITGPQINGRWDPDRLEQVVSNLAKNAALYGREDGTVSITLQSTGDVATITVHNHIRNAPIPEAQLRTMFDPFQRGVSREHATGLGLGLYIVREIVKAHGGVIEVESTVDGTVFRVTLPTG